MCSSSLMNYPKTFTFDTYSYDLKFVIVEDNVWTTVTNNLPLKTAVTGSSRERRTVLQVNYSASMDQVSADTSTNTTKDGDCFDSLSVAAVYSDKFKVCVFEIEVL